MPWRGRKTERSGVLYLCPDGGEMVINRILAYTKLCGGKVAAADFAMIPFGIDLLGVLRQNFDEAQPGEETCDIAAQNAARKAGFSSSKPHNYTGDKKRNDFVFGLHGRRRAVRRQKRHYVALRRVDLAEQ